jgi:predicted metal-dependent hydrolase
VQPAGSPAFGVRNGSRIGDRTCALRSAAEMPDAIPIRRPKLSLTRPPDGSGAPGLPRDWHGGDPFATHFLDALSSTFPFGEAFFVRSVLHYRDRIDDPALLEQIRGFAGQEGQHSRLHDEHLELLLAQGYAFLARRNRFLDRVMRFHNRGTPKLSLAITAALEHLTALLARQVLEDDARRLAPMHPDMAPLWRWHALEESEHKSVAFDVLKRVAPSHGLRIAAMALDSFFLTFETLMRTSYMLWKDGLLFDRAIWAQGWRFLWGEAGLLRGTASAYLAWYRRDFHPDEIDDSALIAHHAPRVAREISG